MDKQLPPTFYYVPHKTYWPIIGSLGLFTMVIGGITWLHGNLWGSLVLGIGACLMLFMMWGWFASVIKESRQGLYSAQLDHSFRFGMMWFIFTEVMFFAAFFGALFYAREASVPWLGGIGHKLSTHQLLWDNFRAAWPLLQNPDPTKFPNTLKAMAAWGIPLINTLVLLSSGITITWAHFSLKNNERKYLIVGLLCTILLGMLFISLQAHEYIIAYSELNLKLTTGIYGSTFFILTGFHGMHVTVGTLMLIVILCRCLLGHFTPEKHFGFEAAAWYWHFVDAVWLCLFVFVYWL